MIHLFTVFSIGLLTTLAVFLPVQISEGEIYGVYLPYRLLDIEESTRRIRPLLIVLVGSIIASRYGIASWSTVVLVAGFCIAFVLMGAVQLYSRRNRRDEGTGASYPDLID